MANTKEIQKRINSIQDTMKITKAMYMMSSMKLRKAKQKLEDTEPYFFGLQEQIRSILYHFPQMQHLYFDNRISDLQEEVKSKGYIVITSDKGMAGAYNHNVIKEAKRLCDETEDYIIFAIGENGRHFFKSQKYNVKEDFRFSANNPSVHRARVIAENIVQLYKEEKLDEIYIVYTKMTHGIKEEVEVAQLLPLKTASFVKAEMIEEAKKGLSDNTLEELDSANDYFLIYPSPKKVLENLVYNYVTGFIYGALVEGSASEENARMMAMQSATDNAEAMLRELSIEYNRVRQAAITQEITEVIGGAKALRNKKAKKKKQLTRVKQV